MKNKLSTFVKTYEDPTFDENGKLVVKLKNQKAIQKDKHEEEKQSQEDANDENEEDEEQALKAQMPLGEGVLKVNLGIPIIVVCNKIDLLVRGEKAQYLESNIDFI